MTAIVIIPARYYSTRFPGKALYPLNGIPLVQHVYERAKRSRLAKDVIVATDSEEILKRVHSFGGKAILTNEKHHSGTDRIAEVATSLNYDIIVNVQCDEPLIQPEMVDDVITILDDERASIGTLVKKIENPHEITDPNVVKVVVDKEGFAIYFSRAPIPYYRDEWKLQSTEQGTESGDVKNIFELYTPSSILQAFHWYKHVGIYSYRKEALISFACMRPAKLELIEKLEQLRAIENGLKIKIKETHFETYGVDTPKDVERVKKCLNISL